MRKVHRRLVKAAVAAALVAGAVGAGAAPASADGPCYTVTYNDGTANPPSVTVCPWN